MAKFTFDAGVPVRFRVPTVRPSAPMSMPDDSFEDYSSFLKLAGTCIDLARGLWVGVFGADWWMKPLLLPFALVYSLVAFGLALVLYPCCLLDVPAYVANRIGAWMMGTADELSSEPDGLFATLFRPAVVLTLCALVVALWFVPKSPSIGK